MREIGMDGLKDMLEEPGRPRTSGGVGAAPSTIRPLRVGLVNNMPDAAYQVAERRFKALMQAAAGPRGAEMHLFALPGLTRAPAIQARVTARYRPVEEIAAADLDALVVTGAEGRMTDLRDEAFWPALARLIDWAERTGTPTLWSCLAAHAAVLHLDGIARTRLARKCSGVFNVVGGLPDAQSDGLLGESGWAIPHSRHNTLLEADLARANYKVLTRSPRCGVDSFTGYGGRFLFCQGHPEYDADALALEHRRDFLRYLRAEQDAQTPLPLNYFASDTEAELGALADLALERRDPELIASWPKRLELRHPQARWRDHAVTLYGSWLKGAGQKV